MPLPPSSSMSVEGLLRLVDSPAAMAEIGAGLTLSPSIRTIATGAMSTLPEDDAARIWLGREGFALLEGLAEPNVCAGLVRAVEALRARELPAAFVYAFDEAWVIGQSILRHISAALGHEYRLVEDVWAWHIPAGRGRGWPAHRGIPYARLDRDAPEIINAWVALTDVTPERSCMHAVPLDDDPGYPGALDTLVAPLEVVRALPAAAGDALFWNANVLHWGGPCSARALGARVSCSFTLCRADAVARFPDLSLLSPIETFDLPRRMDVLARMIVVYGDGQHDVAEAVREWARLAHALSARFGQRKAP